MIFQFLSQKMYMIDLLQETSDRGYKLVDTLVLQGYKLCNSDDCEKVNPTHFQRPIKKFI